MTRQVKLSDFGEDDQRLLQAARSCVLGVVLVADSKLGAPRIVMALGATSEQLSAPGPIIYAVQMRDIDWGERE